MRKKYFTYVICNFKERILILFGVHFFHSPYSFFSSLYSLSHYSSSTSWSSYSICPSSSSSLPSSRSSSSSSLPSPLSIVAFIEVGFLPALPLFLIDEDCFFPFFFVTFFLIKDSFYSFLIFSASLGIISTPFLYFG